MSHSARPSGRRPFVGRSARVVCAGLVALAGGLGTCAPAHAARGDDCAEELLAADDDFRVGRFAAALAGARACLSLRPPRRQRAAALELIAKIHLAQDDVDAARRALGELLRVHPRFESDPLRDSPRFQRLVASVQHAGQEVTVSSVSKSAESLREAPATVVVLTAEEITRRGYRDLEALFSDLPGFDVSRSSGVSYSNLYQRGYRSSTTDRTLFLIDGVEHNDLWSNVVFLSRQFPLSNIDRVEVVYGPASTLYGANAYLGVINVITRQPSALVPKGERFAVEAQLGAGDFDTRYVDATAAGRLLEGALAFSITGRIYRSDDQDLSRFSDWDYSPATFSGVDYPAAVDITGMDAFGDFRAQRYLDSLRDADGQPTTLPERPDLYTVTRNAEGVATAIELTPLGAALARALDQQAMSAVLDGKPVGFSDTVDDWMVDAKLQVSNLLFGVHLWHRREGVASWSTDRAQPGSDNGGLWGPRQLAIYLRYSRALREDLQLTLFSRYKEHDLDPDSATYSLRSYANGTLDFRGLAEGREAFWNRTFLYRSSNQLRNEISLVYDHPSGKLDVVGGVEVRNSSIQADYVRSPFRNPSQSGLAPPLLGEDGRPLGGNQLSILDTGVYAQASYRPVERLKLIAGGRFDHNRVRETAGDGGRFNPRLGIVYSRGGWVLKATYAEAFKDPSSFNRYSTLPGSREFRNPGLEAETATNLELSAGWQRAAWTTEVAFFDASYDGAIELRRVRGPDPQEPTFLIDSQRFFNLGTLDVFGVQTTATWKPSERFSLWGNATFTDSTTVRFEAIDDLIGVELTTADIAEQQLHVGGHGKLWKGLEAALRVAWIGDRPVGPGTSSDACVGRGNCAAAGDFSYFVANGAIGWRNLFGRGVDVQLAIDNLLDEEYFHPGVRTAGSPSFAVRLPQPPRSFFFRLTLRQ